MTKIRITRLCPACGAGIRAESYTAFTCPACGIGYDDEKGRYVSPPLARPSVRYDGLFLVRHLENSPDPGTEMKTARQFLNPGGLLYLEIGANGPWTIPITAARRLIEAAGFRIVKRAGRYSLSRSRPLRLWCRRY